MLRAHLFAGERTNLSLTPSPDVCFLWPAVVFLHQSKLFLSLRVVLSLLVLGHCCFHHVRLRRWTAPQDRQREKKERKENNFSQRNVLFFSNNFFSWKWKQCVRTGMYKDTPKSIRHIYRVTERFYSAEQGQSHSQYNCFQLYMDKFQSK